MLKTSCATRPAPRRAWSRVDSACGVLTSWGFLHSRHRLKPCPGRRRGTGSQSGHFMFSFRICSVSPSWSRSGPGHSSCVSPDIQGDRRMWLGCVPSPTPSCLGRSPQVPVSAAPGPLPAKAWCSRGSEWWAQAASSSLGCSPPVPGTPRREGHPFACAGARACPLLAGPWDEAHVGSALPHPRWRVGQACPIVTGQVGLGGCLPHAGMSPGVGSRRCHPGCRSARCSVGGWGRLLLRTSRTTARGRPEGRAGGLRSDVCPGEGAHECGLPEALRLARAALCAWGPMPGRRVAVSHPRLPCLSLRSLGRGCCVGGAWGQVSVSLRVGLLQRGPVGEGRGSDPGEGQAGLVSWRVQTCWCSRVSTQSASAAENASGQRDVCAFDRAPFPEA